MKAKTKKVPRLVYEIRFEKGFWYLFAPDNEIVATGMGDKKETIRSASERLCGIWFSMRVRSELVIKTKAGTIQDKRTYGLDPRKSKG